MSRMYSECTNLPNSTGLRFVLSVIIYSFQKLGKETVYFFTGNKNLRPAFVPK